MGRDRRLVLEALIYLLAARVSLKLVPFRVLARYFELPLSRVELHGPAREQVRTDVRRAVYRASARLPGTVCFPKAIAAQAMLRRRGVPTTLYCGAATLPGEGLKAHVWLKDGEFGVAGTRVNAGYRPLVEYSTRAGLSQLGGVNRRD